jgi:hypothetical protein
MSFVHRCPGLEPLADMSPALSASMSSKQLLGRMGVIANSVRHILDWLTSPTLLNANDSPR